MIKLYLLLPSHTQSCGSADKVLLFHPLLDGFGTYHARVDQNIGPTRRFRCLSDPLAQILTLITRRVSDASEDTGFFLCETFHVLPQLSRFLLTYH